VKKLFKWTGFVVAGLTGVVLLGLAWVFFASERELGRQFTVIDEPPMIIPKDVVSIAEGERIARLAGCLHCHGEKLNGGLVEDIPNLVRLVAPNISVRLPEYSDAQLATVLRKGVKPDGKSVLFMPSEMYRHMGDGDLAQLIAYLRTVPATAEGVQEQTEVRIIGRTLIALGEFKTSALAIQTLPAAVRGFDANDMASRGRYLTMNFCSECHGQSLEGFAPINAPPLAVAKGYSADQFARLMHDGVALGDRQTRLMSPTSVARFSKFTPQEVAAVHAFLSSKG
jgi:cytochrome c553